jgi:hypothetical protein
MATSDDSQNLLTVIKDLAAAAVSATALAALTIFGALTIAYDEYYNELGLTPADVGVQYGKTLGGTVATAIVELSLITILALIAWHAVCWNSTEKLKQNLSRWRWGKLGLYVAAGVIIAVIISVYLVTQWPGWLTASVVIIAVTAALAISINTKRQRLTLAVALASLITVIAIFEGMGALANYYADNVKEGKWIEPPGIARLALFVVHAFPAEVTPLSATNKQQLNPEGNFFYLGQSGGAMVLYDQKHQTAVFLPVSQIRVNVLNCETRYATDPRCLDP